MSQSSISFGQRNVALLKITFIVEQNFKIMFSVVYIELFVVLYLLLAP